MDFKEAINYILEKATDEEIFEFCKITDADYKAWLAHNLEQSLADCTDEKLDKLLIKLMNK